MAENSFQYFLGRRNARCVALLEANHEFAALLQSVIERAVEYCDHKGIDFRQVRIRDAFISDEGEITARIIG